MYKTAIFIIGAAAAPNAAKSVNPKPLPVAVTAKDLPKAAKIAGCCMLPPAELDARTSKEVLAAILGFKLIKGDIAEFNKLPKKTSLSC